MMKPSNFFSILCGLAVSTLILPIAAFAQVETLAVSAQPLPNNPATTQSKKVVARIWHGTTLKNQAIARSADA